MLLSTDPSVREQHLAVRSTAGWYDFTHRLVEVTGEDAAAFLSMLYAGAVSKTKTGRAKYTVMLDGQGKIIDDVIIFHMEENTYWVSTLYTRNLIMWYDAHREGYRVDYRVITSEWRMYSVQGPKSKELVNAVVSENIDGLKFFSICDNHVGEVPVKVARSGYTGEKWGYEIYIGPEQAPMLEKLLEENSIPLGAVHITEVDVMALTLACEAGYILMLDIADTTPFEVGFGDSIDWEKDFIGKSALEALKDEPPKRQLLGFTVEDDDALIYGGPHGNYVRKDGVQVGRVTKYTHGFSVKKNIGYALVDTDKAQLGDTVDINGYPAKLTEKRFL